MRGTVEYMRYPWGRGSSTSPRDSFRTQGLAISRKFDLRVTLRYISGMVKSLAGEDYISRLTRYGGMATTGENLGVMVAPEEASSGCPAGWIFVPLGSSIEIVREAMDRAREGRKAWPPV